MIGAYNDNDYDYGVIFGVAGGNGNFTITTL